MADYGLTDSGWVNKPYTDILSEIEVDERARLYEGLELSEQTVLGNINAVFALQSAEVWEALAEIAGGLDPDRATGSLLVGLAKLSGVIRRGETYGEADVTVTVTAATEIAAGGLQVLHVDDSSSAWRNVYPIVATGAGTLTGVLLRSVLPGAGASAAPGTLTVISPAVTAVSAVTNPLVATSGTDVETFESLRLRREQSLALAGGGTTAAIRSELLSGGADGAGVAGIVDATVLENDTDTMSAEGVPPKSLLVLIWDGDPPDASDSSIGEAILRAKAGGVSTYGDIAVTAEDPGGVLKTVHFSRMTPTTITIAVGVSGDVDTAGIKTALVDYCDTLLQGDSIVRSKLIGVVAAQPGVEDVLSLSIQGVSANYEPAFDEKPIFSTDSVSVVVVI